MPKWSPPSNFSIGYLENLAEGEAALRLDRAIRRRIGKARFPVIKTLDHLD